MVDFPSTAPEQGFGFGILYLELFIWDFYCFDGSAELRHEVVKSGSWHDGEIFVLFYFSLVYFLEIRAYFLLRAHLDRRTTWDVRDQICVSCIQDKCLTHCVVLLPLCGRIVMAVF